MDRDYILTQLKIRTYPNAIRKLSIEDYVDIWEERKNTDKSYRTLASKWGVSDTRIRQIEDTIDNILKFRNTERG